MGDFRNANGNKKEIRIMAKTIYEILTDSQTGLKIPCAYSHFRNDDGTIPDSPPYVVYLGAGQTDFSADNTYIWKRNNYQIEYYFTEKNEAQEAEIEKLLLDNGFQYDKSDDVFIDDENVFVIYYTI